MSGNYRCEGISASGQWRPRSLTMHGLTASQLSELQGAVQALDTCRYIV